MSEPTLWFVYSETRHGDSPSPLSDLPGLAGIDRHADENASAIQYAAYSCGDEERARLIADTLNDKYEHHDPYRLMQFKTIAGASLNRARLINWTKAIEDQLKSGCGITDAEFFPEQHVCIWTWEAKEIDKLLGEPSSTELSTSVPSILNLSEIVNKPEGSVQSSDPDHGNGAELLKEPAIVEQPPLVNDLTKAERNLPTKTAKKKSGRPKIEACDAGERWEFKHKVELRKQQNNTPMWQVAEEEGMTEKEGKAVLQWCRDQEKNAKRQKSRSK